MRFLKEKFSIIFLACTITTSIFADTFQLNPQQIREEKKAFIQEMVHKYHFNHRYLEHLFYAQKPNSNIIESMTSPFEKQPWSYYRHFFLTKKRIELGAAYLKKHHYVLMQMQKKYGIPASIITAIVGVETEYGEHVGTYPVFNTLYTLSFYYPPREKFFKKELAQYFILTRDNHLNIQSIKGSYAGALGIPQFMPSSYRHYGVSYIKNRPVNLFHDSDAIASVANYFYKMGWQPNQPIARHLKSKHTWIDDKTTTRITLPLQKGAEYWGTFRNFNVIMSYNHNVVYAMVVYQLSRAIDTQYEKNRRQA